MIITYNKPIEVEVTHIEVSAKVRYWEDATVNGLPDDDGALIPFRKGDLWCPRIRLSDGIIEEWPANTIADIHYKVCDAGEYWLTDEKGNLIVSKDGYVPDDFLCHGDIGYGDYIIMKVGPDGAIQNYCEPDFDSGEWKSV